MANETQIKRCKQCNKNFEDFLKELSEFVDAKLDTAPRSQIQLRLNDLILNYDNFKRNQTLFESLDETQFESKIRTTIDRLYYNLRPALEDKIADLAKKKVIPVLNVNEELSFIPKLPEILLDTFTGEITRWKGFIESFDSHVHNNPKLNDLTKFQYLKNSVKGSAGKCFENLDFISANYDEARRLLIQRFDKPNQIAEEHIKALFSMKPIDKPTPIKLLNLLDDFNSHVRSLKTLDRPVQYWDDLLVYLIVSKFDSHTKSKWKEATLPNVLPSFEDVVKFIHVRSHKISEYKADLSSSSASTVSREIKTTKSNQLQSKPYKRMAFSAFKGYNCVVCNQTGHSINRCHKFIAMSVDERKEAATNLKLCTNCLRSSHLIDQCNITDVCHICKIKHHTLLHSSSTASANTSQISQKSTTLAQPNSGSSTLTSTISLNKQNSTTSIGSSAPKFIFLATALVEIRHIDGHSIIARALLDSGSQLNFITHSLINRLGVKTRFSHVNIKGIACASTSSSRASTITIHSRINQFSARLDVHILSRISDMQPSVRIDSSRWLIPANVSLADPSFCEPHEVDLLLGADIYFKLQSIGQIRLGDELPILQNTVLGWVVAGGTSISSSDHSNCNLIACSEPQLDELLERFWNIEECQNNDESLLKSSDCDKHFQENFSRDINGKFIVKLPFIHSPELLGDSSFLARRRFLMLEKRLNNNPEICMQYNSFMKEYQTLNHMEMVKHVESMNYYLPHHYVMKPDSSTTKLRVVFDGSAKSSSGYSINDLLMNGPVVQNDLFAVLLRFRSHIHAFTADICKMYRQILLHSNDQQYHYIFWRYNSSDELQTYKLKTVTYGTTSAPYLATRCLLQLALDSQSSEPTASSVIRDDFYVDDLLTGSDTVEEAAMLKTVVTSILHGANLPLRKWCCNNQELLSDIPEDDRESQYLINDKTGIKTLEMYWHPISDHFRVNINLDSAITSTATKRKIISQVAKIFDPLGLVSPIVVVGKLLLQKLWSLKVSWDEALPMAYHTYWVNFLGELPKLAHLNIPRHLFNGSAKYPGIQLHGFADASEKAYGAAIYVRFLGQEGYTANLMCSKSRVAPLKHVTLPRLELCAAQLLAKLMQKVFSILNFRVDSCYYWTDSMITLHWIKSSSSKWKTYVAHRVSDIQARSDSNKWLHVESKLNPADLISRGTFPELLMNSELWWFGPNFLHSSIEAWDNSEQFTEITEVIEEKHVTVVTASAELGQDILDRIHGKNSLVTIQNAMGYALRFIHNCRFKNSRTIGPLNAEEIQKSLNTILRLVQSTSFPIEYNGLLKPGFQVRHPLLKSLSLFMDQQHIIRVGGRLKFAAISYTSRHPALLPSNHYFTTTLMSFIHRKHLHVGPQALLAAVRQSYWPINGKQLAKKVYRSCVMCCRVKPKFPEQLMADLPPERVNPAPPFYNVGIDYAGPLFIHYRIRGKIPTKTYLAVFVCLATRAVHLELASDLTSASFIGAFRRFIATRGLCKTVFSDNGTNFVAANSDLHDLFKMLQDADFQQQLKSCTAEDQITWKFSPPGSPHFGGIYEAVVKSAKYHIRRTMGNANLTYEELNTLIKQVEAVLNSRPITPLTTDDSLEILTPGHFLVGRPLTAIPEPNIINHHDIKYAKRWELVNLLYKQFWSRWSTDYLQQLQHRYFWKNKHKNIAEGTIVIIKDPNLPPLKWKFGKITDLHTGRDGLVRVASIKTSTGTIKRAIVNLCPLPVNVEPQSVQDGGE